MKVRINETGVPSYVYAAKHLGEVIEVENSLFLNNRYLSVTYPGEAYSKNYCTVVEDEMSKDTWSIGETFTTDGEEYMLARVPSALKRVTLISLSSGNYWSCSEDVNDLTRIPAETVTKLMGSSSDQFKGRDWPPAPKRKSFYIIDDGGRIKVDLFPDKSAEFCFGSERHRLYDYNIAALRDLTLNLHTTGRLKEAVLAGNAFSIDIDYINIGCKKIAYEYVVAFFKEYDAFHQ